MSSSDEKDFYEENQELIDKRREALDEERLQVQSDRSHQSYWMRCPKCGVSMHEVNISGVIVDQCSGCNGLFFDNGELETLLQAEESGGFFNSFRKLLDN